MLSGTDQHSHASWRRPQHPNARRIVARVLLTLTLAALFAGSLTVWRGSSAQAHSASSLSAKTQKSALARQAAQTVSPWGWFGDPSTRYWLSGDFNGDGKTDIDYITDANGHVFFNLAFSNGDGTYSTVGWTPTTADNNPWPWLSGSNATWLTGDFNGDGRTDLAYIWNNNGYAKIYIAFSNGDGSFNTTSVETGWGYIDPSNSFWTTGDFNNDGNTDIAYLINSAGRGYTGFLTLLSNGDGSFNQNQFDISYWPWITIGSNVTWLTGDFNGDGQTDFAMVWNSNGYVEVYIAFSNGDSSFSTASTEPGWAWLDSSNRTWLAGDFNGDGKSDLAYLWDYNGQTEIYSAFSNGDGSFAAQGSNGGNWIGSTEEWTTGDANGDGKTDIIHLTRGEIYTDLDTFDYLSQGDGSFTEYGELARYSGTNIVNCHSVILWGDFNGDHIHDFVCLGPDSNNAVQVYTELGTNNFSQGSTLYQDPIDPQTLGFS